MIAVGTRQVGPESFLLRTVEVPNHLSPYFETDVIADLLKEKLGDKPEQIVVIQSDVEIGHWHYDYSMQNYTR